MWAETGKKHLGETKQMRMRRDAGRYVYIVRTDREEKAKAKKQIILYCTYYLRDENGIKEDGYIETHKVF